MRWSRGKNDINTIQFLAQTDRFGSLDLNVSSQAAGFNLVLSVFVFLTLKAVSPIDCHYMTDRLQRFELKIFVCVLLKKQSHLHLGCPGCKQITSNFHFWVNYHFNWGFLSTVDLDQSECVSVSAHCRLVDIKCSSTCRASQFLFRYSIKCLYL